MNTTPKPRPCDHCKREFMPKRPMQSVCSQRCARMKVQKVWNDRIAQEKANTKARRLALETIPVLIKKAQVQFNAFIRGRDKDQPCICCGRPLGAGDVGGAFDCGHYRSTGSAPHLRFHELNAHAQNKVCNRHGAGRAVDYRIGLVARIGWEAVEALESDNRIHKWTREELRGIAANYRAKLKQLKES